MQTYSTHGSIYVQSNVKRRRRRRGKRGMRAHYKGRKSENDDDDETVERCVTEKATGKRL